MGQRSQFRLNRQDKKIMGVCSGIADHFDIDATLVRVAMVLALILTFPLMLFVYLGFGLVAKAGPRAGYEPAGAPRLTDASVEATRMRIRDMDRRLQAIETHVTSSNTSLAREIDSLR